MQYVVTLARPRKKGNLSAISEENKKLREKFVENFLKACGIRDPKEANVSIESAEHSPVVFITSPDDVEEKIRSIPGVRDVSGNVAVVGRSM